MPDGRDLVVSYGLDGTTIPGAREHEQQHHGDNGDPEHHVQVGQTVDADQRLTLLTLIKALAAGDFEILDNDADDLTKAKRDDGQIVAVQTQCRNADKHAEHAGDQAADNGDKQESHGVVHDDAVGDKQLTDQGGGIRTDGFEAAAAKRQLAKHADGKVQRSGHDHRDAAGHDDTLDIQRYRAGLAHAHKDAEQHDDADGADKIGLFGGKHRLLHRITPSRFPVRPSGRTA